MTEIKAMKSIKQFIPFNSDLHDMMEDFRQMVNQCIRIGLENNCSTLKRLSLLSYHKLDSKFVTSYKLNAISQACGRLAQMKRDIKKGKKPRSPYIIKPYITNCYGFKTNGVLFSIPYKPHQPINVLLNDYSQKVLSDTTLTIRSFTLNSENSLSISVCKKITPIQCTNVLGIDRNLGNITVGNHKEITIYNTSKLLSIKENTVRVMSTFKRNDHRILQQVSSKLGRRRTNRVNTLLHNISKKIVQNAVETKSMIILEDLKGIRKLYRKGNGQGNRYRRKLNSWSFYELQRQIEYKAKWEGIPVEKIDAKHTSQVCPRCEGKLQGDRKHKRDLWCSDCKRWQDRDVIASMNIAYKGWLRHIHPKGDTVETMRGNVNPLILRVDVSKPRRKSNDQPKR